MGHYRKNDVIVTANFIEFSFKLTKFGQTKQETEMAGKKLEMKEVRQILTMLLQGHGSKFIQDTIGVSKNTVKSYRNRVQERGADYTALLSKDDAEIERFFKRDTSGGDRRKSDVTDVFKTVADELKKTGMTLFTIWSEYRLANPDGYSYSQFCKLYGEYTEETSPTMHISHEKADKLYVDYTGKKIPYVVRETGELLYAEVFIATMGFSEYTYVEASESQKQECFAESICNALEFFGGVPVSVVPDNLKSAVIKPDKYSPQLNATFEQLSAHYGFSADPARSLHPKDKSLVERHVTIVYQQIFARIRNMTFFSIQEINDAIRPFLVAMNSMNFQRMPCSRSDLFEQERGLLSPLPQYRFEFMKRKTWTVGKNYHFELTDDKHYYSVPYPYTGKKVSVSYNSHEVRVFYDGVQVAYHLRDTTPYRYTTVEEHMPPNHRYASGWSPEYFIEEASKVSPEVNEYITRILYRGGGRSMEQRYKCCMGILSFGKRSGNDRLTSICRIGISAGVFTYEFVKNCLSNKTDLKLDAMASGCEQALPEHENIRGAAHYEQEISNQTSLQNEPDKP